MTCLLAIYSILSWFVPILSPLQNLKAVVLTRVSSSRKKGRGKGSPQKRSNHRADSAASDLTGDESSCASVGLMSPSGGGIIESIALNFNSPPQGNPNAMGFR